MTLVDWIILVVRPLGRGQDVGEWLARVAEIISIRQTDIAINAGAGSADLTHGLGISPRYEEPAAVGWIGCGEARVGRLLPGRERRAVREPRGDLTVGFIITGATARGQRTAADR